MFINKKNRILSLYIRFFFSELSRKYESKKKDKKIIGKNTEKQIDWWMYYYNMSHKSKLIFYYDLCILNLWFSYSYYDVFLKLIWTLIKILRILLWNWHELDYNFPHISITINCEI